MKNIKAKHWISILSILILSSSCVEEYWPEINSKSKQLIVVDGKISNLDGPYTIKLSLTNTLPDTSSIPIQAASVTILDNNGNQELLNEISPGVYKTSLQGIQGVAGRSYKTKIQLSDGRNYESDFEELRNPVGIEDVQYDTQWQYARNELETDQQGYQFYVSSTRAGSLHTFLYWEIEETFEYHSNYQIYFYYDGTIQNEGSSNFYGIKKMHNRDSLFYCWTTQKLKERYSYSLENLSVPELNKQPLHFISFKDERLRYGYNILVKQYTISEKAYTFLNYLKKQNENPGGLFTSQPFQIKGNIKNTEDPTETVLGYFIVAGAVNAQRIQVRSPGGIRYQKDICYADPDSTSIQNRIERSTASDWPLYFTYFFFEFADPPGTYFAYVAPDCLDCTRHGGVAIKPEFWQQ